MTISPAATLDHYEALNFAIGAIASGLQRQGQVHCQAMIATVPHLGPDTRTAFVDRLGELSAPPDPRSRFFSAVNLLSVDQWSQITPVNDVLAQLREAAAVWLGAPQPNRAAEHIAEAIAAACEWARTAGVDDLVTQLVADGTSLADARDLDRLVDPPGAA